VKLIKPEKTDDVIRRFENLIQSSCAAVEATSASTSGVPRTTDDITESSETAEDKSASFRFRAEDFVDMVKRD
jgi:hypothetical protein